MIIIINGSLGVGKSTTAEHLHWTFKKSIHLDGDQIGNVNPFEIYDKNRITHLYDTLALLTQFHQQRGYPNIVINYIFESADSLQELFQRLSPFDPNIHTFWLTCEKEVQAKRIHTRSRDNIDWELKRFVELQNIQSQASKKGFIGKEIDTTQLEATAVADLIWREIHSTTQPNHT